MSFWKAADNFKYPKNKGTFDGCPTLINIFGRLFGICAIYLGRKLSRGTLTLLSIANKLSNGSRARLCDHQMMVPLVADVSIHFIKYIQKKLIYLLLLVMLTI